MTVEIEFNEEVFKVEFSFIRGSAGDYMNPPEPHDLLIESIIAEDGWHNEDPEVWDYADEEIYNNINDGHYD